MKTGQPQTTKSVNCNKFAPYFSPSPEEPISIIMSHISLKFEAFVVILSYFS